MLTGTALMALLLSTPAQPPAAVKVYYPVPVASAGIPYTTMAPCPGNCPAPGACADGCCGLTWTEKLQKLCGFFCYKSAYRTPCCARMCAPYTPPVYAWFQTCADGSPTPAPCQHNSRCPACLRSGSCAAGCPAAR